MAKVTLNTIASGYASVGALNTNFDRIEDAFENTLSRDGTAPNFMEAVIDMNSNKVINLGAPSDPNDAARLADIQAILDPEGTSLAAQLLANTGGAAIVSFLQSGTGAVVRTVQDKLRRDLPLTPNDFGATGDGVTDCTAHLNTLAAVANALYDGSTNGLTNGYHPRIHFPPCAGYVSTTGMSVYAGVEIVQQSPLLISKVATTAIVGIDLTNPHTTDYVAPRDVRSDLDVRRITQSTWATAGEGDIGVRCVAGYNLHLRVRRADNFTVGVYEGIGYAELEIGDIRNCQYGVLAVSQSNQFINQHLIYGRSINSQGHGAANNNVKRYGIEVRGTTTAGGNTIVIEKISFELGKSLAGSADAHCIHLNGLSQAVGDIVGRDLRSEFCDPRQVKISGAVNHVDIGFLQADNEYITPEGNFIDWTAATGSSGTVKVYRQSGPFNGQRWGYEVFDSGKIAENIIAASNGVHVVRGMMYATPVLGAAPAGPQLWSGWGGLVTSVSTDGYVTPNSSFLLGVGVDLNGDRSLAVIVEKVAATTTHNLRLFAYDSSGVQIYATGKVFDVRSIDVTPNTTAWGGFYDTGLSNSVNTSNVAYQVYSFASDVARVVICSTSPWKSIQVRARSSRPRTWHTNRQLENEFYIDMNGVNPAALTNVTYQRGMTVWNYTAGAGAPSHKVYNGSAWVTSSNLV